MLHVVQPSARPTEHSVLRAMFAARKEVFVDLLKWDVPVLEEMFEVDQFDTPAATYLVLTDDRGGHLASARLLPTTRPHLLDSFYRGLCDAPPPRACDIVEITRFCLGRGLGAARRRLARDTLVTALAAHALDRRLSAYTAIAELAWFEQIRAFGWRCRPLGRPQPVGAQILVALAIEIDTNTPAQLRTAGIRSAGAMEPGLSAAA